MTFGDLKSDSGLKALNEYLSSKSYIEGYVPSQADLVIFEALSGAPNSSFVNALRWFKHIASYAAEERKNFGGSKKSLDQYGDGAPKKSGDDDDDDDELDLFGSDDEEDEEAEKLKQERIQQYADKKKTKKVLTAKSLLVLDVKPWSDETDLAEMEKKVRSIEADGLVWGGAKLVPVGYGIKKLQISCVIEDDKIFTDWLEEEITAFEELVQSMDIAAFNKL